MKKHTTRIVSLALVLVLLTAIFSGLTVTGAAVSYNFNTGNRHTLCTSLSTQAVTYYNTNGIVLDQLCALSGDSTGSSIKGMTSPLYQKLQTLMKTTKTFSSTYSRLTSYWPYTDASNGKSGVQLFYSDTVGTGYNREHVWPKSRGQLLSDKRRLRSAAPAPDKHQCQLHTRQLHHGQCAQGLLHLFDL
jgi:hypothetical protein